MIDLDLDLDRLALILILLKIVRELLALIRHLRRGRGS